MSEALQVESNVKSGEFTNQTFFPQDIYDKRLNKSEQRVFNSLTALDTSGQIEFVLPGTLLYQITVQDGIVFLNAFFSS